MNKNIPSSTKLLFYDAFLLAVLVNIIITTSVIEFYRYLSSSYLLYRLPAPDDDVEKRVKEQYHVLLQRHAVQQHRCRLRMVERVFCQRRLDHR